MTQDQNKKSLRQFQCREYLWDIFEQMGAELECSTDYLINEAMRQYARSRNWGSRAGQRSSSPAIAAPASARGSSSGSMPRGTSPSLSQTGPLGQTGAFGGGTPQHRQPMGGGASPSGASRAPRAQHSTGPVSLPPPLPGVSPSSSGRMPPLSVIFNGQKFPVNKEEFVIGRGSKTADLPIKDGNISRRHAAIVFQNGAFFMRDLGSTNGIEFNGERVDNRRIEEGDLYQLCDYELRFTYR